MKTIEAPEDYRLTGTEFSLFLAGGITACPDWQSYAIELVGKWKNNDRLVVFNPRRKNFDISETAISSQQIEWESKYLQRVNLITFWFCEKPIQPITLFELGRYSHKEEVDRILVGADRNYIRRFDIEKYRLAFV